MSIQKQLQAALAATPPFDNASREIEATFAGQTLRCRLVELDRLGCSFMRLALEAEALKARSTAELKGIAERLSKQITYLLEPISPVEVDAHGCVVQMRSMPPQKQDNRTTYYELLVSREGAITLERYERASDTRRQTIAAHVTREVLVRLAGDFSAAVA